MRKLPPLKSRGRPWGSDRRNQALQWVWRVNWRRDRLAAAVPPGPSLLDGLLAYWPMDESAGMRADVHGAFDLMEYDIYLEPAPGSTNAVGGVLGDAARPDYDGVCLSPLDPVFDVGADFTLAFWLKQSVAGYSHWVSQNSAFMVHGLVAGDALRLNLWSEAFADAGSMDTSSSAFYEDTWHHIAVSKTAALVTVYVDGVADATTLAPVQPPVNSTLPLMIGSSFWGYGNGTDVFDEFGVWQRALSAAEVSQLYNGGDGLAYELF